MRTVLRATVMLLLAAGTAFSAVGCVVWGVVDFAGRPGAVALLAMVLWALSALVAATLAGLFAWCAVIEVRDPYRDWRKRVGAGRRR